MPKQETIERILSFADRLEGVDQSMLREALELIDLHQRLEHCIENMMPGSGLTARQVDILEILYHSLGQVVTSADLSEEVGLTRSAMTSALDSLERMGYVRRGQHPSDRRMLAVSMTDAGENAIAEHLPIRYRHMYSIVSQLTPSERKTMRRVYNKLILMLNSFKEGNDR
ncbi:MAG TPA: MarR family transcriptional regulator [bacterium]|nr:MarR family transcriptional regulator [bacterium]